MQAVAPTTRRSASATLRRRMTLRRSASLPKESVKLHLQDYCSSTSIHALKYVAEPRRPRIEKAWWMIILITCFVCNIILIRKMWLKFNEKLPEDYAVFDIPFPAITICNEIKIKKSLYDALKMTKQGEQKLQNLKLIERYSDMASSGSVLNLSSIFGTSPPKSRKPKSSRPGAFSILFSYDTFSKTDRYAVDGIKFLIEATPSMDEMMTKCVNVFTLTDPDCNEWFARTVTDLGICYSANVFDPPKLYRFFGETATNVTYEDYEYFGEMDWLPDPGVYRDPEDDYAYPYRALSNGRLFGFSIELKTNKSDIWEHRNNEKNSGFKVLLHRPEEVPVMREPPIFVPIENEVVVMVTPVINTISDGLKAYKPKDRKCYLKDEKRLSFFLVYTQKNCELECLTNFTYNVCHCVAIHMPRNKTMRICSPSYRECVLWAEIDIMAHRNMSDCLCWPTCFSIEYKSSHQYGKFASNSTDRLDEEGFFTSKLVVFFEDNKFPNHQRREIVDFVDFLSNCGGLLGLFSGMSILSFCEIFYYLTLRLWNNVRLVRQKVVLKAPDPNVFRGEEGGDIASVHDTNTQDLNHQ